MIQETSSVETCSDEDLAAVESQRSDLERKKSDIDQQQKGNSHLVFKDL